MSSADSNQVTCRQKKKSATANAVALDTIAEPVPGGKAPGPQNP